jgi:hypothetical protein
MKLNSAQVERALSQLQGKAIPDSHPVVPQLNNIFGEHTFSSTATDSASWSPPAPLGRELRGPK